MASAAEQAELEAELLQLIADTQTTNYLVAASLTLAVIEHVATFGDEFQLIWKGPLRISNAIYIWVRRASSVVGASIDRRRCDIVRLLLWLFIQLVRSVSISIMQYLDFHVALLSHVARSQVGPRTCQSFLLAKAVTSSLIVVTADIILVLRVWVLYGRPKTLLYFLLPLVTVEIITMIIVGVFTILPLREYFHIGPAILGCYSLNVPRYFTFYAVPITATSFTMFMMTLYKCGRTLLDNRAARLPIITLFLRDGLFWFLAIFAINVAELLVWARGRPGLAQVTVAPGTVLNTVIGTRILLNLKRLAIGQTRVGTTVTTIELERIAIAGSPRKTDTSSQPWHLRTTDTRDL
ncbi:hypothetical protein C8R44DRAFT_103318 [Mycena epipterygia]|nr:hypothetical protein C8R44DRAFT_103318 [Mycena epipterygia]